MGSSRDERTADWAMGASVAIAALAAVVDFCSPADVVFSMFYVLPLVVAPLSRKPRFIVALGAVLLVSNEISATLGKPPLRSAVEVMLLNRAIVLVVIAVATGMSSALAARSRHLRELRDQAVRRAIEAQDANRVKDQVLMTLSHELRTPITAILSWLRVIEKRGYAPADVIRGLAVVERSARAQARLVDDLVELAQLARRNVRLNVSTFDVGEAAQTVVEAVAPAAAEAGVVTSVHIERGVPPVQGDRARIEQVIWNLLTNALKFAGRGGSAQLVVRRAGDSAELVVRDSGPGIREEFLPYVFEPFRQDVSRATMGRGGIGVGLSIVKELVQLHGGVVRANGHGPLGGAELVVSLPEAPVASSRQPVSTRGEPTLGTHLTPAH